MVYISYPGNLLICQIIIFLFLIGNNNTFYISNEHRGWSYIFFSVSVCQQKRASEGSNCIFFMNYFCVKKKTFPFKMTHTFIHMYGKSRDNIKCKHKKLILQVVHHLLHICCCIFIFISLGIYWIVSVGINMFLFLILIFHSEVFILTRCKLTP